MYKRSSTLPITHNLLLYLLFPGFYHLKNPYQFNYGFDSCIFLWIKIISINRNFFHSSFSLTILTSLVIKHIHQQLPTGIRTSQRRQKMEKRHDMWHVSANHWFWGVLHIGALILIFLCLFSSYFGFVFQYNYFKSSVTHYSCAYYNYEKTLMHLLHGFEGYVCFVGPERV